MLWSSFWECPVAVVLLLCEWWGAGVVFCLELGADLHMTQLMPLPLTVSCFSKIQIGFAFLVPAHPGSPGKRAIKRVCMCVCYCCVCLLQVVRWRSTVRHFVLKCRTRLCCCQWMTQLPTLSVRLWTSTAWRRKMLTAIASCRYDDGMYYILEMSIFIQPAHCSLFVMWPKLPHI